MKQLFKIYLLILFCFFMMQNSFSQKLLTEREAIASALENNFNISLVKIDSSTYDLNNKYGKTAYLPTLVANTGTSYSNNNQFQKFTDGTQRKRNNIASDNILGNVQMNWTIFNGYKISTTKQKLQEYVNLGNINIKIESQNTVYEVLKNYYNIVYQKQVIKSIEEQMTLNEERIKLATQKLKSGLGSKPELLQAKVDLNAQKTERLAQIATLEKLKQKLNQIRNVATFENFNVVDSVPINVGILLTDILSNYETTNPALALLKKNMDIANITLKENKNAKYPLVNFNSVYNFTRTDNKAVVNNFSPLFNRNNGLQFGIGVSLPIFNNYAVKHQTQITQINIARLNVAYQQEKSLLDIAIQNAYKDYQYQKQILLIEEENIILAKENVQIAFERFKAGVTNYIELKVTQTSLENAYTRLLTARYKTKVAEIDLLKLKGY